MYIFTMYTSCIFKNLRPMHTVKKKQFFIPLYSCLSFNILDSKMKAGTFLIRIVIFPLPGDN